MFDKIKSYLKALGAKGSVRNHSSKELWVIETTTNHPNGPALAHLLKPGKKSPLKIDADGFKRVDNVQIGGHKYWWKIGDLCTADIFDAGKGLFVAVSYKSKVKEDHFGSVVYIENEDWAVPINYIVAVKCNKKGVVEKYNISNIGWVSKHEGIKLARKGMVDLVVVVESSKSTPFLRSYPGLPNLV